MKLLAAVLMAVFLVGCAGGGFDPKEAHPDAWEAARGTGSPGADAGDNGDSDAGGDGGDGDGDGDGDSE